MLLISRSEAQLEGTQRAEVAVVQLDLEEGGDPLRAMCGTLSLQSQCPK